MRIFEQKRNIEMIKKSGILWVLIGLSIIITLISPNFIRSINIITILKQISMLGILAIGSTFVLISGGIDLSVGSIVALAGVCAALVAGPEQNFPIIVPFLAAIGAGIFIGILNGLGVAFLRIPSFIMTLGFMISARGLALLLTRGRPIFGLVSGFEKISNGIVFMIGDVAVPSLIFYFLGIIVIASIILKTTVYGIWLYAVGGNEDAAVFSGINVQWMKTSVYMFNGALAGLCGILMASRINSGDATVAQNFALDAIAASVIGGVSLSGGIGTIWKTVIGALIIGVMQNGLQILGVSPFIQTIVQGLIIILAVFFDIKSKGKR